MYKTLSLEMMAVQPVFAVAQILGDLLPHAENVLTTSTLAQSPPLPVASSCDIKAETR